MKHVLTFIFLLFLIPQTLPAIKLENRMPESVWQAEISIKIVINPQKICLTRKNPLL